MLRVIISRSLVGSSKIRKFGFLIKTVQRYNRFFSPPLSLLTKSYCFLRSNKKRSNNCCADIFLTFFQWNIITIFFNYIYNFLFFLYFEFLFEYSIQTLRFLPKLFYRHLLYHLKSKDLRM